ncbi:MAG TPA: hypothetical protein VKX28_18220 [Xanthobacteraceae bacterium]|nr:hypothetical protein [Xanthobacteraceae bacterium]
MYWLLLLLSVIATAVGLFAIGFGLMPFEGSLGNAYLIAGAVGVVGGMILFALAAAVRDLRRIAAALAPRASNQVSTAARRQAPLDAGDTAPPPRPVPATPPPARIPYPPRPGSDQRTDQRADPREMRIPDQRETRFERPPGPPVPPQPPAEMPEPPPPRERPRPQVAGPPRMIGEAPMMEEHEEVPLAPSRVAAPPMRSAPPPVAEPPSPPEPPRPPEPRPSQADIMARLSNLAATPPRPAPRPEPPRAPPPPPAERQNERENERQNERVAAPADPRRANMFDALWPAEVRAARQSQSETIARAPRPEQRPEPRPDSRSEQRPELPAEPRLNGRPEPRGGPPMPPPMMPPTPREPPAREPAREPVSPLPAEPRTIAILKSGVIDGMAYTLYTDGSIEAELPQGTMRFASIDDLRSHLENSDRPA